ncbi:unnamed protein product [Rotaria sp. Silwood1]|nr:unnamed protein product [Rotaria sp. Silwood1]
MEKTLVTKSTGLEPTTFPHAKVAFPQINLDLTDGINDNESNIVLQHNCLHVAAWIDEENDPYQIISYCMSEWSSKWNIRTTYQDQNFTFAELNKLNITSEQLYLWSAPMDVVEHYQFYLNLLLTSNILSSSMATHMFYNCTSFRFGPLCQYSLDAYNSHHLTLNEIIHEFYRHEYKPTTLTCYTHLQCNRGSIFACLDWSEICDGIVDCQNGVDEESCWQMEINECEDNEDRCLNGQCIPKTFFHDDPNVFECLDRSDERDLCIHWTSIENGWCDCGYNEYGFCEDEELNIHYIKKHISFPIICDGFTELIPVIIDGRNETDETECEYWQCNNTYTRCNGFWNCLNGADEVDCDQSPILKCPLHHHICVSPDTYQFMCLPLTQANDGNIDCLGATDEPQLCRSNNHELSNVNFHCTTGEYEHCTSYVSVCFNRQCTYKDYDKICDNTLNNNNYCTIRNDKYITVRSDIANFFCKRPIDFDKSPYTYFSLDRINNSIEQITKKKHKNNKFIYYSTKRYSTSTTLSSWSCC